MSILDIKNINNRIIQSGRKGMLRAASEKRTIQFNKDVDSIRLLCFIWIIVINKTVLLLIYSRFQPVEKSKNLFAGIQLHVHPLPVKFRDGPVHGKAKCVMINMII